MNINQRLNHVYQSAKEIPFDDHSKFILFSDCHRGNNSPADNFGPNKNIFLTALNAYYSQGYTYIEIGDGDELWENRRFSDIINAHNEVFIAIKQFFDVQRFYMVWGNHDILKQYPKFVKDNLYKYYNRKTKEYEPLFPDIELHEGLILKHSETSDKIFIVHGHQGDILNDQLWPIGNFLVGYIWKPLELSVMSNRISPATNLEKRAVVERSLESWIRDNNQLLIAGHTHRTIFPEVNETPYFNTGCCVFHNYITGIEINQGEITLVRWGLKSLGDSSHEITREISAGPRPLKNYFKKDNVSIH